jgi:methyltransferase (TIGR00027 family)
MIDTKESVTAKLCSFARAYHSNYSREKIFDDYLAYDMMGKEEYDEIWQMIEQYFAKDDLGLTKELKKEETCRQLFEYASIPLSRISFAEQRLNRFAEEQGYCQYVICGAGMDTFTFRNSNPHIMIYELDHPDTQSYKLNRIRELQWNKPRNVRYVPIDFEGDSMKEELIKAGFKPELPAFFSILGVTYYLTLPIFEDTIRNIAALSEKGNLLVFDYLEKADGEDGAENERSRYLKEITASLGEEMKQGFSLPELREALASNGFDLELHLKPQDIQNTFFNGRSEGYRAFENVHFISAVYKGE